MRALPEPGTVALVITGRSPAEVYGLCERVRALLEHGDAYLVVCHVR